MLVFKTHQPCHLCKEHVYIFKILGDPVFEKFLNIYIVWGFREWNYQSRHVPFLSPCKFPSKKWPNTQMSRGYVIQFVNSQIQLPWNLRMTHDMIGSSKTGKRVRHGRRWNTICLVGHGVRIEKQKNKPKWTHFSRLMRNFHSSVRILMKWF